MTINGVDTVSSPFPNSDTRLVTTVCSFRATPKLHFVELIIPQHFRNNKAPQTTTNLDPYNDGAASAPPPYTDPSKREGPYGSARTDAPAWQPGREFPTGIKAEFVRSAEVYATRYWIIDNSGSMATVDGHIMVEAGPHGPGTTRSCSRWAELTSTMAFHAEAAARLRAPTEFRLLNYPGGGSSQVFSVGTKGATPEQIEAELEAVRQVCRSQPTGSTPLCAQIRDIVEKISRQAPELRAAGQKAVLVIASDGAASDGDVSRALEPLSKLPVWVVIRLCTDDDAVVKYWNNVDNDLELEMDVLDDLESEAKEIDEFSPWFTYGAPMHRLREWGATSKVLDVIDERPLVPHELLELARLLFGEVDLPQPELGWQAFKTQLELEAAKHATVWDPIREKQRPWIKIGSKLSKSFKGKR